MLSYNKKLGFLLLAAIIVLAFVGILLSDSIPQDPDYHNFSDQRRILGIPNFWNVISNFPLFLVGIIGLYSAFFSTRINIITELKISYVLFFLGVTLVSFGSGYYHLLPENDTLVWDRMPMTIAFMALFSVIIGEFVSCKLGKIVLWPLIFFGGLSVLYWSITESNGIGDLRPYILVQFLPLLLIPILLIFFKSKFTNKIGYWFLLLAYLFAKALEYFDGQIYSILTLLSGHTIKHVVAALGVLILLNTYGNRVKI